MRPAITFTLLCLFLKTSVAKPSRAIELADAEVGRINTALGYSTILQFDSRPTSVVLGDQDGFKVEYVGNSLTLKPLAAGGKTNLFVFTDYERFSFQITVGARALVDYVVQVKRKRMPGSTFKQIETPVPNTPESEAHEGNMTTNVLNAKSQCGGILLSLDSIAYAPNRTWALLTFRLTQVEGKRTQSLNFKAEDLALRLNGKVVQIETLYLEHLHIPQDGSPNRGSVLFRLKSKNLTSKLQLVFTNETLKPEGCKEIKVSLGPTKPIQKVVPKHESNIR